MQNSSVQDLQNTKMSRLVDLFDEAAAFVKSPPRHGHYGIDRQTKLTLYGLYKQAKEGPCTRSRPSVFNFFARRKWDAWDQFRNLDQGAAMRQYIDRVDELKSNANLASRPDQQR